MNPILIALVISLALSVTANGLLGWQWLGTRDDLAKSVEQHRQTKAIANECSENTDRLASEAYKQGQRAEADRAKAKAAADAKRKKADQILLTPPTVPGNDCKSAMDRAAGWLKGRK
jgi:regulator of protease activity HflC (stomatin/prohibitin superfamily)